MSVPVSPPTAAMQNLATFVSRATVPPEARAAASTAFLDTIGVMLAGAAEPAARAVQATARAEGGLPQCRIVATGLTTSASWAALANGTAAHALDYDDMCFVSLAHPSAPLVAAALAGGEVHHAAGQALLDAWVIGFEIEAVLGRALNPRHYTQGWHNTSTIGTLGAAAAVARIWGLDPDATARCLAIAASEASGLKENFGTDTKPLHAGLAARNGVVAARLARSGLTASASAVDGPQGLLTAMAAERPDLCDTESLGRRWEVLETGVTVKLYPSCAGTHPALDAILDLRRKHRFTAETVESITVGVDPITPSILLYDRPRTGLEGKFSMPFCAAAAVVNGEVGLDTFEPAAVNDPRIRNFLPAISMVIDDTLPGGAPALTQARVTIRLRSGPTLTANADGARGYPARPASAEELKAKFRSCALRVLDQETTELAIGMLVALEKLGETGVLTKLLSCPPES